MPGPHDQPRPVLLYDGSCRFCIAGKTRLLRLAAPGSITPVNSKDPGALARYPQVSDAAANRALQLVHPDGRVDSGAAAICSVLETRPAWRTLTWLYRVPGIRQLTDALYAVIARNRYRIAGRAGAGSPCDSGACEAPPADAGARGSQA